jgi:anti-sigma factor RsiW
MKPLSCKAIRASFSEYLDGAVSGLRMQQIARHIEGLEDDGSGVRIAGCEDCARELAAWRATEDAVSSMGPVKAPADLALRLRVAISHEHARQHARLLDRLSLAWENAVRPMLLQVTGGLVGSVALIGGVALLSAVAAPTAVLANDEPLGALTSPHFLYSTASPVAIITENDTAVIVEASVDTHGRVYDYTIVAGPQDQGVRTQVANQLLGSVFQPASAFGVPVRSRVVLTFAGISVHG